MVNPLLKRAPALAFGAALVLGVAAGCSFYSPTVVDCAIACGESGSCPGGTKCRDGFCRLESSMGDCACQLGDTRECGGGRGECKKGTEVCTSGRVWSGVCVGEGRPSVEVCNNKDDDCDGLVDDEVTDPQACSLTLGVCAGKKNRCESGAQLVCEASDYGSAYQVAEARCDSLDNDCDGFTDIRALSVMTNEASPTAPFQLLAMPQGFALVYERRPAAGMAELIVARYDEAIVLQRSHVVARPAPGQFWARSLGQSVFVATTSGGGVGLTRVNTLLAGDAGLEGFEPLVDAGFSRGLRLGVGEQAVSTFLADEGNQARMLIWQFDGGLSQIRDLNSGPGVPASEKLYSVNVSDRGHFVIYSADDDADDGGVRQLTRLGDGRVWAPPYAGDLDAQLHEWDAGVSSTYAYSDTSTSLSGVYFLPDMTQGIREVAAAASFLSQQWGAAASFRTPAGDLTLAMQERVPGGGQQIVVGTSVPVGDTFSFRLRNLDGGAGVPAVVASSVEPGWLFVGWRDMTSIRVRKVCAP
jgi:hypothetical protein